MNAIKKHLHKRIPGILYLLLAISGFYTPHVLNSFAAFSNQSDWFEYFHANSSYFATGIISFFIMNIVWILLAYSLYAAYRTSSDHMSRCMLLSVVAGSITVFVVIILQSIPLYVLSAINMHNSNGVDWIQTAYIFFTIGKTASIAPFIFYSIWLFPLAWLFLHDTAIPLIERVILFISLFVAGTGYLADFLQFHFSSTELTIKITDFTFYGEVVVLLWLLIRGPKTKEAD